MKPSTLIETLNRKFDQTCKRMEQVVGVKTAPQYMDSDGRILPVPHTDLPLSRQEIQKRELTQIGRVTFIFADGKWQQLH